MSSERLAWLAGIVDGEGSIAFYVSRGRHIRRDGHQSSSLRVEVTIGNTDERIIREVLAIGEEIIKVKGSIKYQERSGMARPCWYITFSGSIRASEVLCAVIPYLIAKRERAEIVLGAIQHRRKAKKGYQAHVLPPLEVDEWLTKQFAQFKALNKRGREVSANVGSS